MLRSVRLKNLQRGFTIIELLVVFSIIAVISTVSLASFASYSRTSSLKQTASLVGAVMTDARSRALSQIKPSACAGTLNGYQVDICGLTGSSCATADTYTLSSICSGTKTLVSTKRLPSTMHFTNTGTTSRSFQFRVLNGGVVGSGTVMLTGFNGTIGVTVSPTGAVDVQ